MPNEGPTLNKADHWLSPTCGGALSPERVAALPPPTLRIRQLEQERSKLLCESDELRCQLHVQKKWPVVPLKVHGPLRLLRLHHLGLGGLPPSRSQKAVDVAERRWNIAEYYSAPAKLRVHPHQRCSHVSPAF
ncbi:hypothetical protein H4582DRAFT_1211867 [Lactarius indigo]|nr:hypothetical protein H4582DRAFT_1211867 [Lactarius indigo]